jgi:hypothetical protein
MGAWKRLQRFTQRPPRGADAVDAERIAVTGSAEFK